MQSKPTYSNPLWLDKPYYSLNAYCRHTFHEKLYKIAIDAGMTCPNRDGTLGSRGCIFCSAGGSGEFSVPAGGRSIAEQIQAGLSLFGTKSVGQHFIAYFQAYTNTYAPPQRLYQLYFQALSSPKIAGISIATRPDCLSDDVLFVLSALQKEFPNKFIWIELGLQTIHEQTADYIRRGYPLSCFFDAVQSLHALSIPIIVHIILGLPGETDEMIFETIHLLNGLPLFGIKLQLLHVLKQTDLANDYRNGLFQTLTFEHYVNLVIACLEHLSPDIVVHRITGDAPKDLLIAPAWSLNKRRVLNTIHHEMRLRNSRQGKELL